MKLKTLAENAVSEINDALPHELTAAEMQTVEKIVDSTLIQAIRHTSDCCRDAAAICCGPEADLAHKIAEKVELAQKALISNLMGLR